MVDSQRYPLINNVEDIVGFLDLKVFNFGNSFVFSYGKNAQVTLEEKTPLKIISF